MKIEYIISILIILGFTCILLGFYFMFKDTINESRCYNSTLYEFYHNNYCKRYWKK